MALLLRFGFFWVRTAWTATLFRTGALHWQPTSRVIGFTVGAEPTVYIVGTAMSIKLRKSAKPISYCCKFVKHSRAKCVAHKRELSDIPPSSKCKNSSQRARNHGSLGKGNKVL